MSQYFGKDFEIIVSANNASKTIKNVGLDKPLPKMGYELDLINSECKKYTLKLMNISGQFFVGSNNCTKSNWVDVFKFDLKNMSIVNS